MSQDIKSLPLTMGRIRVLAKLCRNRGGACGCTIGCKAVEVAQEREDHLRRKLVGLKKEIAEVERIQKRLNSPMATLRDGFQFIEGLTPVIVFDGDEASFGYEDADGEWVESNTWPFNEGFVWHDDCERHGIRVE